MCNHIHCRVTWVKYKASKMLSILLTSPKGEMSLHKIRWWRWWWSWWWWMAMCFWYMLRKFVVESLPHGATIRFRGFLRFDLNDGSDSYRSSAGTKLLWKMPIIHVRTKALFQQIHTCWFWKSFKYTTNCDLNSVKCKSSYENRDKYNVVKMLKTDLISIFTSIILQIYARHLERKREREKVNLP